MRKSLDTMDNPFSLMFGREPYSIIPRRGDLEQIEEVFDSDRPRSFAYVITGVRGCGKTVLLASIQKIYSKDKSWIVLRLNPDMDLFESSVSQLSEYVDLKDDALLGLNVSLAGIGMGYSKRSLSDNETLLRKMLGIVKRQGKKALFLIDEASNSSNIKTFFHSYQAYLGEDLPAYLLMTALPENFYSLSNSKNGTFLKRMPKVFLGKLNMTRIKNNYMDIFSIPEEKASEFAGLVNGYSFAYQVLGDLIWESGKTEITDAIIREYDTTLDECVYTPIWEHLTESERKVVFAITNAKDSSVKSIREVLGMESNEFSPYSSRLANYGLIDVSVYGKITFVLPRFEVFVRNLNRA